jgi:hypothetical protein
MAEISEVGLLLKRGINSYRLTLPHILKFLYHTFVYMGCLLQGSNVLGYMIIDKTSCSKIRNGGRLIGSSSRIISLMQALSRAGSKMGN